MDSAITFTSSEVSKYYAARVPQLKQRRAAEWRGPCPVHRGTGENFTVNAATGEASCFSQCGRGWDILGLEQALTGTDFKTAKAEVFRIVGRTESPKNHYRQTHSGRIVATYDYPDEAGRLLYQAVRMEPKRFWQRRPDGNGGWIKDLEGVRLVLYRVPELLKRRDESVYICEGEKDVHTLESFGLLATCNPMGAGRWRAEYSETLRRRAVVILPDNDGPGRKDAMAKAESLLGTAGSVRIVELPGLPDKGDVTDWRNAGGTFERFRELTEAASPMDATALSMLRAQWGITDKEPKYEAEGANTADAGSLTIRCLSEIEAKPVSWLWPDRIARGKLTIIAGNPGLGKSQITASIAAIVTRGGRWPVDRRECEPGDVLFLTAEDDPADTLRPRLEAAGANLSRVHIVDGVIVGYAADGSRTDRTFSLQKDIQALGSKLTELGEVAAVVIDPISAYLGDTDSHKNAEVRSLLTPLSEFAARHDTAVIGVSHLTKAVGNQALLRVTGSLAFVAAARAAYLVTPDPQDPMRRFFLPMKNNLGPDATGLAFHIERTTVSSPVGTLETSRVCWESEPVRMTADEAMQARSPAKASSAFDRAKDWLQNILEGGPVAAEDVSERANAEGIANRTLQRASRALNVQKDKLGMTAGWSWSLPSKMAKSAEDVQASDVATFEGVGDLREPGDGMAEVEL